MLYVYADAGVVLNDVDAGYYDTPLYSLVRVTCVGVDKYTVGLLPFGTANDISYDDSSTGLGSTVQVALDYQAVIVDNNLGLAYARTAEHVDNPTDAHDASAVSLVPPTDYDATDVQAFADEISGSLDGRFGYVEERIEEHEEATSNAHAASAIMFQPTGTIAADNVQAAIAEVASEAATADNSITNAKLADMVTARIKGRVTASTGDPEDLTAAQVTALLDVFTTALKGLVPASGGGTAKYLRADATWVAQIVPVTTANWPPASPQADILYVKVP